MATLDVALPPVGIILEQVLSRMARRWCGVASSASTTTGLGGMEQRGLDGGCMLMEARREVATFGITVTLMLGQARSMC
jgi:hypothetical protein